jgi:hypothetical protein
MHPEKISHFLTRFFLCVYSVTAPSLEHKPIQYVLNGFALHINMLHEDLIFNILVTFIYSRRNCLLQYEAITFVRLCAVMVPGRGEGVGWRNKYTYFSPRHSMEVNKLHAPAF